MARIVITSRVPQYKREVRLATDRALRRAAEQAARDVRGAQTRYRLDSILSKARVSNVTETGRGLRGIFVFIADFRALFFELGTYTRRRRPLKQPRRTTRANKGVFAQYFLLRASRRAKQELPALLKRELSRIR